MSSRKTANRWALPMVLATVAGSTSVNATSEVSRVAARSVQAVVKNVNVVSKPVGMHAVVNVVNGVTVDV
jgi:hypothetical protein